MKAINKEIVGYLRYCEKVRQMSKTTLSAKQNILKRFIKCTKIESLTYLDNLTFDKWVAHETERGVSSSSINTYNAVILAMVRYYREIGMMVPLNLTLTIKLREIRAKRNFYSKQDIMKVIEFATPENALMIKILFETGMRIAELKNLKISDFNGRRVRFVAKGRKIREAYITEKTLKNLRDYVEKYKIDNFLWAVRNGQKL